MNQLISKDGYVSITEDLAYKLIDDQWAKSNNKRVEQKEQTTIIKRLETEGFKTLKTVVMGKAGEPDIIAVSTVGQVWFIEVKPDSGGRLMPLQKAKLLDYWQNNAVVMVAYGYTDFKAKFSTLMG